MTIYRNPGAKRLLALWLAPDRCEQEARRWRDLGIAANVVALMMEWCPRDNDQDALNRMLVAERIQAMRDEKGGIAWECKRPPEEIEPDNWASECDRVGADVGIYGSIRVVGARVLNRLLNPGDPTCLFNGTACHMYGQTNGYRTVVMRTVLENTYRYLGML